MHRIADENEAIAFLMSALRVSVAQPDLPCDDSGFLDQTVLHNLSVCTSLSENGPRHILCGCSDATRPITRVEKLCMCARICVYVCAYARPRYFSELFVLCFVCNCAFPCMRLCTCACTCDAYVCVRVHLRLHVCATICACAYVSICAFMCVCACSSLSFVLCGCCPVAAISDGALNHPFSLTKPCEFLVSF